MRDHVCKGVLAGIGLPQIQLSLMPRRPRDRSRRVAERTAHTGSIERADIRFGRLSTPRPIRSPPSRRRSSSRIQRRPQPVLLDAGLLLVVRAHRAEKPAVRDAAAVEDVAPGIDDEVDVLEANSRALENPYDGFRDEIDVLAVGPRGAQLRLRAGDDCDPITALREHGVTLGSFGDSRCAVRQGVPPRRSRADRSPCPGWHADDRALVIEADIVLPGEPDATVQLDGFGGVDIASDAAALAAVASIGTGATSPDSTASAPFSTSSRAPSIITTSRRSGASAPGSYRSARRTARVR